MNKRMAKKLYRQLNNNELIARRSCIYCCAWGLGCANGHPDVYPDDRSDYLHFCKEKLDSCNFLANQLKREGFSLSGWRLDESELPHKLTLTVKNLSNSESIEILTLVFEC